MIVKPKIFLKDSGEDYQVWRSWSDSEAQDHEVIAQDHEVIVKPKIFLKDSGEDYQVWRLPRFMDHLSWIRSFITKGCLQA